MNLNDLHTFIAVAESMSFSLAAQQLHITQPAVTKRIQNLEANFHTPLFDRIGRRVSLTQAGQVLLPNAKALWAAAQDTQRKLQNLSNTVAGELRIATSHHIGLHRLAPVLKDFRHKFAKVQLNISFEDSEVAYAMARQGDVELAVVTLNPAGDDALQAHLIWPDPLHFVSATAPNEPLSLTQLAELPCVLPGTSTYTGRIVLKQFDQAGLTLRPAMATNYLETIGMLVAVGLGWSVLPSTMVGDLEILPVQCAPMSRQLGYVLNPKRALSNAGQAFLDILRQYA